MDKAEEIMASHAGSSAASSATSAVAEEIASVTSSAVNPEPPSSSNAYRTWMEDMFDVIRERKLYQLTLPGTHDSGAYDLSSQVKTPGSRSSIPQWVEGLRRYQFFRGVVNKVILDFSVTQSLPIAVQLDAGIRYFDFRVCLHEGEFHAHHGFVGPCFSQMFAELRSFMRSVKRELVIVHASHFSALDSPDSHRQFIELVLQYLGGFLLSFEDYDSVNCLCRASFGDLVGSGPRIIFIYDDDFHENNPSKHFWPGSLVYSHWADTTDMTLLAREQAAHLATHQGSERQLFVLQWLSSPQLKDLRGAALGSFNPFGPTPSCSLREMCKSGPCEHLGNFLFERKEQINIVIVDFFECTNVLELCVERCLVYADD